MDAPTYESSRVYSDSQISEQMNNDWLYYITGGALSGQKGKQIMASMNKANDSAYETALMDYENWYNSPEQQLSREYAAGVGTGSVESLGSATPSPSPTVPGQSDAPQVLSAGVNILNIAIQGYQFITSAVARMSEVNDQILDTASEGADLLLSQSIPYKPDPDSDDSIRASLVSANSYVDDFMKSLPSAKHRRYMKHRISSLRDTPYHRSIFNKQKFDELHSGQEVTKIEADPRNQGSAEEIFTAWNKCLELFLDSEQNIAKASSSESKYKTEYFDSLNAEKQASSENYRFSYAAAKENFLSEGEKILNKYLSNSPVWIKTLGNLVLRWLASKFESGDMQQAAGKVAGAALKSIF